MSGGFDRRSYARLYARARYQRVLREKRMSSRVCPRRFGRHGVCGALLVSMSDGRGGLVVSCPACQRFEAGICRLCALPVCGAVRKARYCATHRIQVQQENVRRYQRDNREAISRRAKKRHRSNEALRLKKAAYKRLWRKANPDKVRAQKRREALRQNPHVYEYHRQYRARIKAERAERERLRHHGIVESRNCLTPNCATPVSGRAKKCAGCKDRERRAAINALAPTRGRGKRTDLRRVA